MIDQVLILVLLIAMSGFFSGAEIAMFSLSDVRIRSLKENGGRRGRLVAKLRNNPDRLLITILLGNNIVNILASAISTVLAIDLVGETAIGAVTGILTFVILTFGEIIPKSYAAAHALTLATLLAPLFRVLQIILFSVVIIFEGITKLTTRMTGGRVKTRVAPEEELKMMAKMGMEEGSIDKHEHAFIERVFQFDDKLVKEIMTPRSKVVCLDAEAIIEQCAHFIAHSPHSRMPVFRGATTNVVGYIHAKTILQLLSSDDRDKPVRKFVSPILKIDSKAYIDQVFRKMQASDEHIALVVNRHGKMLGIVTMEDLLEQLVGDIKDETD